MLGVMEKLAVSQKLLLSLGMDGHNVHNAVMEKVNGEKKEKG